MPEKIDVNKIDMLMMPKRLNQRRVEIALCEGFADEVLSAELHRLHRRPSVVRQHDDWNVSIDLLEGGQRVEPVHLARHDHVENDRRRTVGFITAHRIAGVIDRDEAITALRTRSPNPSATTTWNAATPASAISCHAT